MNLSAIKSDRVRRENADLISERNSALSGGDWISEDHGCDAQSEGEGKSIRQRKVMGKKMGDTGLEPVNPHDVNVVL